MHDHPYLYRWSTGEASYATEELALRARERNHGRGFIFLVDEKGTETCIA